MGTLKLIVSLLGGVRATLFALLALFALSATGVQTLRLRSSEAAMTAHLAADAKAEAAAQLAARTREYEQSVAAAKVAADYEKAKQDAQAKSDSLVADLRAGIVRLRREWQGCQAGLLTAPATAGESDAAAASRERGAVDLVRIAATYDAWIKALQDLLKSERK